MKNALILLGILLLPINVAKSETFQIQQLPVGKQVTLLKPATTSIPLNEKVALSSTNSGQTVSFKTIAGDKNNTFDAIKLSIYEQESKTMRFVTVKKGTPFLYTFKGLETIMITPTLAKTKQQNSLLNLQVESNHPLSIGRR